MAGLFEGFFLIGLITSALSRAFFFGVGVVLQLTIVKMIRKAGAARVERVSESFLRKLNSPVLTYVGFIRCRTSDFFLDATLSAKATQH